MDGGGYTGWRDTCTVVGTLDGGIHVQWWVHWMEGYMYSGGYTAWMEGYMYSSGIVASNNKIY